VLESRSELLVFTEANEGNEDLKLGKKSTVAPSLRSLAIFCD